MREERCNRVQRGEAGGRERTEGECCERCLNKAVPLYRSPAL